MRGLKRETEAYLVACGAARVDPAHQDPVDEIRVVEVRLLAHLVGDGAEGLGLLAACLDRLNEFAATGELLAGRDALGLVGHLAHLPDEVGQSINAVMLPVPDIAIRAVARVEGAADEPNSGSVVNCTDGASMVGMRVNAKSSAVCVLSTMASSISNSPASARAAARWHKKCPGYR